LPRIAISRWAITAAESGIEEAAGDEEGDDNQPNRTIAKAAQRLVNG
jgi:hypothetical protein